ncbi:MAG TPA: GNAT family N-acetyltransferase, partial [Bacilli bacterium]|nr:GNAT family N-acetyltransferase [Bacilli bacterium]
MKRKTITASQDDILVYWNQEFGSSYPLTKRLFQEKILDSKELVDDGSYSLYYQEEYIGSMVLKFNHSNDKKLQDHAYLAFLFVNPKFRNQGYGSLLISDAIRICTAKEKAVLYIGGDNDCLFSGLFLLNNDHVHQFFKNHRFNIAYKNYNLICREPPALSVDNYEYTTLKTEQERDDLLKQIRKLFPIRWYNEVMNCEPEAFFVAKEKHKIVGFVRINTPHFSKIANSVNTYPLYPHLGGIGPVAIFPEKKGSELANNIVKQAVNHLFTLGCSDVIVDWTNFIDYFKASGFSEISNSYVLYELRLYKKHQDLQKHRYQKIENDLRHDILEGKYKHGDIIPSEVELAAYYKVTRMTVRQAINNLLTDGLVYRHKGRGTFVTYNKQNIDFDDNPLFSFANEQNSKGDFQIRVLVFEKRAADELLALRLQLKIGDLLYYVERMVTLDNKPMLFERMYLPANMYEDLQASIFKGSFKQYAKEQLHWHSLSCQMTVEARGLSGRAAEVLHLSVGSPALYCSTLIHL